MITSLPVSLLGKVYVYPSILILSSIFVSSFSPEQQIIVPCTNIQEKCVYMNLTDQNQLTFVSKLHNTIEID